MTPNNATNTGMPSNPALAELRDIHLPDAVSWWPIAWPWWLMLILLIAMLGFVIYSRNKNAWRTVAIKQLQSLDESDPVNYALNCNRLLKQICFNKIDATCASLSGMAWLNYLDEKMKKSIFLPDLEAFAFVPDNPNVSLDTKALNKACQQWIRKVPC